MGCGPSENLNPGAQKLKIWGDYFSQDTRALLAISQMANADVDFVQVNSLELENQKAPFTDQNPNGTIPMLTHGMTKVIGDGDAIYNYLINTSDSIRDQFSHEAQAKKVQEIMNYFQRIIRRVTSKLIQVVVVPKVMNKPRKISDDKVQESLHEFFDVILAKVNSYVGDQGFITGAKVSVVDIMLFCEIQTICVMYKKDLPDQLTKLKGWYENLSKENALQSMNTRFSGLCQQYNLYYESTVATTEQQ